MVTAIVVVQLSTPGDVTAAGSPAPVFRPVLSQLRASKIPVFLPSWLPRFERRVYPVVQVRPHGTTYEVDLSYVRNSTGTAALAFYLTANLDALSPGPRARRIPLGHGVTAFLGSIPGTASDSLTIRWRRSGVVYVVGRLGSETQLIHCARSVVRVVA